jgi:hypothetical protein
MKIRVTISPFDIEVPDADLDDIAPVHHPSHIEDTILEHLEYLENFTYVVTIPYIASEGSQEN